MGGGNRKKYRKLCKRKNVTVNHLEDFSLFSIPSGDNIEMIDTQKIIKEKEKEEKWETRCISLVERKILPSFVCIQSQDVYKPKSLQETHSLIDIIKKMKSFDTKDINQSINDFVEDTFQYVEMYKCVSLNFHSNSEKKTILEKYIGRRFAFTKSKDYKTLLEFYDDVCDKLEDLLQYKEQNQQEKVLLLNYLEELLQLDELNDKRISSSKNIIQVIKNTSDKEKMKEIVKDISEMISMKKRQQIIN